MSQFVKTARQTSSSVTRVYVVALYVLAYFSLFTGTTSAVFGQTDLTSRDGYVRREGQDWVFGTSKVEKRIRLADGLFSSVSLRNKVSGQEYRDRTFPAEIHFLADGHDVSASDWRWSLLNQGATRGDQGELRLDVKLESSGVKVTKHFVIYPGTSVIREWLTLQNSGAIPLHLNNIDFLRADIVSPTNDQQFNYLTGGGNYNGSQLLKSEVVTPNYSHTLDSKGGIQSGNYSSFLPLAFLINPKTHDGVAVGWDYLGHWRFDVSSQGGSLLRLSLALAGFDKDLGPGEHIETPKVFVALFTGGIDELGNQLLDWQYEYLWEFTNPDYFAKTRWAVDWPDPWVGEGGTPSADNWGRRLALDLRYIDLLRETGTDILWDDAGWYDKWGTWNGPDWKRTNDYLRKYNMRWVLWYPTFLATPESAVAQRHPDWMIPGQETLEQSVAATADWQTQILNSSVGAWGDYQWRYDIAPAASGNDTDGLAADQNFRKVLERFKSEHPQSGIDACDGGGRWISYDISRLADSGEYTDGGVGPYSAYYTSLLIPPDKLHNVVDFDHTYYNASTDHTHLAMNPTWYRDPGDGPDVESIRKDWDTYHYLVAEGVVGRWSHVFRPAVDHDDPVWYFQRMNQDGSKGVILTKHQKHGATYYLVSRLLTPAQTISDEYRGDAGAMNVVNTSAGANSETGIYQDPVDGAYRFYGVPGESFGPLNLKYRAGSAEESLVTKVVKLGAERRVGDRFFGMAISLDHPITVTEAGQYDPGNNRGNYALSLVRAADRKVISTINLDMSHTQPDAMGFKYARLPQPLVLDVKEEPIVIYPRGLIPTTNYEVRASVSGLLVHENGVKLMSDGITLDKVAPGEILFLNLARYPGSGTDHIAPTPPSGVTKRLGSNLGVQGIELSWSSSRDDNWISYYEVRKNGRLIGKTAKGTYFFDHSISAPDDVDTTFEVAAVDGDGNRSAFVKAKVAPGALRTYESLGTFAPVQRLQHWAYEETDDGVTYRDLIWDKGGYEGRWTGSGLGRIGRIWMQPSAAYDLSRTFIVPKSGAVDTYGEIRKDPSADNAGSCFVRILLNSQQLWPVEGWAEISPDYNAVTKYMLANIGVSAGDTIRFVLKHNGENRPDPIVWNPVLVMKESTIARDTTVTH
jgi:hypothetical protein